MANRSDAASESSTGGLSNTDGSDRRVDGSPHCNRRRLLAVAGSAGVVLVAGCVDDETPDDPDDAESYEVQFVENGEETAVTVSEAEELLYAGLDAGVDIPYACEVGSCGDCTVRHDGDATDVVIHEGNDYLSDEQIEDGWVLTCVAYPRDDSRLEVAHPDDE